MSTNAISPNTPVSDTGSEGRQSPATSGAEELVRNSIAAAGLVNVPPPSNLGVRYWFDSYEPSSWRTPSPTSSREPSASPPELTERSSFTIPQTLIPTTFVRQTLDAARSWESTYGHIEAALTHRAGTTPFVPTRSLTASPHSTNSCPLPVPHSEPIPVPPPTERQHSVGTLPTHSGRPNSRSPVRCYHPYQKKSPKPRRYNARPEELREEEILALSQIPTGGRMLTRSYLGKIKRTPLPPYPVSD
jgi:hypothetical protein